MKLRKLRRVRRERNGWPYTVKIMSKDGGYDPFTLECWLPKRKKIPFKVTTWKNTHWRNR